MTEGGSSGSGLFTAVGSPATEYRLRGGLHGGPSSCTATGSGLRDYYSRLDQAYPSISQYLDPGTSACTYSLSPTSASLPAAAGSGSFTVTTPSGCAWTAASNASWITTTSAGTGGGSVVYTVSANAGGARSGAVTAGGQTFTVSQAAVPGATNSLVNGDFESGVAAWTQTGSLITNNAASANAGSWYALLGGANSATHELYQDVAIPADAQAAAVQFWYSITTAESGNTVYDRLIVSAQNPGSGATLATLVTLTNVTMTSGWVQSIAYDVSAFKGQTVRLKFNATTDSSLLTHFRIDDVALTLVGGTTSHALTVAKAGTGTGTVNSSPAGIACGDTCSASFSSASVVTLSATASSGSTFAGWSGAGCNGAGSCQVTMDAAKTVTATFDPSSTADLAIAATVAPDPASAGKDVMFTLTVTNNGPAAASGITLTNPIPAGSSYIWASSTCVSSSATVTCNLPALVAGASAAFKVVVRPTAAGSITNNPSVAALQSDPISANNSASTVVTVNATPVATQVLRYRLYSDVTKEHHFTTDLNEYNVLGSYVGTWVKEGTVGKMLDNPGSFGGVAAVPYYRLYDTATRWHHWTTDSNEYYTLVQFPNWNAEGVDGYLLPTQAPGSVPLYRLLYPFVAGLHHWTIDANEYNTLTTPSYGWIGEGGSGFVIP